MKDMALKSLYDVPTEILEKILRYCGAGGAKGFITSCRWAAKVARVWKDHEIQIYWMSGKTTKERLMGLSGRQITIESLRHISGMRRNDRQICVQGSLSTKEIRRRALGRIVDVFNLYRVRNGFIHVTTDRMLEGDRTFFFVVFGASKAIAASMEALEREFTKGSMKLCSGWIPRPARLVQIPDGSTYGMTFHQYITARPETLPQIDSPPPSPSLGIGHAKQEDESDFVFYTPDILSPASSRVLIKDVIKSAEFVKVTIDLLRDALLHSSLSELTEDVQNLGDSIDAILKRAQQQADIQKGKQNTS
ncbi:hypothetical protein HK104_006164, partial [Borealophlyctis nickersoniae]